MTDPSWTRKLRQLFLGRARDLGDRRLFHQLSLIAVLAWVGLGADGLSSSCYGPEEAYKALGAHPHLALLVAGLTVFTIAVLCTSYAQIIERFPSGGGGYLVASQLLSPAAGVVSGSALLVDYVLTIAISVAGAADAAFSLSPPEWHGWKLAFTAGGIGLLTVLNLRGVRESVLICAPVFFLFVATHALGIGAAIGGHAGELGALWRDTAQDFDRTQLELGWLGLTALVIRAFAVGAGTFTGIEAVSNGLPVLREPRVRTGRRTMLYMGVSLAVTAAGLLFAYVLADVRPVEGRTLNAVLFTSVSAGWSQPWGQVFVASALIGAAALLFIAAQAGFLDGPRVLANLALDRWMPNRFASLSDRFVAAKGVVLMGGLALAVVVLTRGQVALLVVLYSINVFITFFLSQLGMVRMWWRERRKAARWRRRLAVNAIGLALSGFMLVTLILVKFHEGGWITLVATGAVIAVAFGVRAHYRGTQAQISRLDALVAAAELPAASHELDPQLGDTRGVHPRTAIVFVNGFNGLGLHTLLGAIRLFGRFRHYVFVQVGIVDAGNFKGAAEVENLRTHIASEVKRYVAFVSARGGEASAVTALGHDVVEAVGGLLPPLERTYPDALYFGGQLVFARETWVTRLLHNFTVFALQRKLVLQGRAFAVVPIRVEHELPAAAAST